MIKDIFMFSRLSKKTYIATSAGKPILTTGKSIEIIVVYSIMLARGENKRKRAATS